MDNTINVLGISGSLRKASFNTALLRTAIELAPEGVNIERYDIAPIPFYNGDVMAAGLPEAVRDFKEKIRAADALLIVTPEYNYSVPGVLKNALDWGSHPPRDNAFHGKTVAIMGAGGMFGTVRAQMHLRNICVELGTIPVSKPEVLVQRPWEKFDPEGRLTDEQTKRHMHELLIALQHLTLKLKS